MRYGRLRSVIFLQIAALAGAQSFRAPAGSRPAHGHPTASILPGGRVIAPWGLQRITGAGTFNLAVQPGGKLVVTANTGPGRASLSILERDRSGEWQVLHWATPPQPETNSGSADGDTAEWRGVSTGIALAGDHSAWISEGNSGKVSLMEWPNERRRSVNLNTGGLTGSFTGDLAYDSARHILYVADPANSRVAALDTRTRQVLSSAKAGHLPFALALSTDRRKLYVTNIAKGAGQDASPVAVLDVSNPASLRVEAYIRTGSPPDGGSAPCGIVVVNDRVFVANANRDTITVIDGRTNSVSGEIPIRIPGLESLRGILPAGLAYHERTGWLLVAESGINAVAVVDTREQRVIGHLPVGWYPARVAIAGDTVFVANAHGWGQGPSSPASQPPHGSVSIFPIPSAEDLAAQTKFVMEANGLRPGIGPDRAPPAGVRYVVLIVKQGRTYDEVFGDIEGTMGSPALARFGMRGYADGERRRVSIREIAVTPNHHALARQWAISDNFYTAGDGTGRHWLAGTPPNLWTEFAHPEPESGGLWAHLERHGIRFRTFGEEFGGNPIIPDQVRAAQFIREIEERYAKGGGELPRFLVLHLPNDRTDAPRAQEDYPYRESYIADNDSALGRVVEYLSGTKWWKEMAVFVTEDDAQGGIDHVDAHRTVLMAIGPWVRRGYVSHRNTSYPGLLKTIFRILALPPLNLFDASATDLSDLFAAEAAPSAYKALSVDKRLYAK